MTLEGLVGVFLKRIRFVLYVIVLQVSDQKQSLSMSLVSLT